MKEPELTPTDQRAFSNSTEGEAWMANWCDRCLYDLPAREGDYEEACGILLLALGGQTPGEWVRQEGFRLGDQYQCTQFRPEDSDDAG